jgi:hypothetical protein
MSNNKALICVPSGSDGLPLLKSSFNERGITLLSGVELPIESAKDRLWHESLSLSLQDLTKDIPQSTTTLQFFHVIKENCDNLEVFLNKFPLSLPFHLGVSIQPSIISAYLNGLVFPLALKDCLWLNEATEDDEMKGRFKRHIEPVTRTSLALGWLAHKYGLIDIDGFTAVVIASCLHDIAITVKPKSWKEKGSQHPGVKEGQEIYGPVVAEQVLTPFGFPNQWIRNVMDFIHHHRGPVLQEILRKIEKRESLNETEKRITEDIKILLVQAADSYGHAFNASFLILGMLLVRGKPINETTGSAIGDFQGQESSSIRDSIHKEVPWIREKIERAVERIEFCLHSFSVYLYPLIPFELKDLGRKIETIHELIIQGGTFLNSGINEMEIISCCVNNNDQSMNTIINLVNRTFPTQTQAKFIPFGKEDPTKVIENLIQLQRKLRDDYKKMNG